MKTSQISLNDTSCKVYTCGRCAMFYQEYKQLLEHLYWRHGTESRPCKQCGLRRWLYAAHACHILPIEDIELDEDSVSSDDSQYYLQREEEYCCGKFVDAPMIGCDGARCAVQWYHFTCVGVVTPPDGEWFCTDCSKSNKMTQNNVVDNKIQT